MRNIRAKGVQLGQIRKYVLSGSPVPIGVDLVVKYKRKSVV